MPARPTREVSLVELFTSQLCPGCPVADAYLIELARRPELLCLSFSVTHYDRGEFKDPFGQEAFSARHFAYARAFHHADAFTPDIVINGHADAPGMATGFVEELLVGAQLDGPAIIAAPGGVAVAEGIAPAEGADVWVAHYEPRVISVPIRGSAERSLPQINVVRGLYLLGEWKGAATRYEAPPLPPG